MRNIVKNSKHLAFSLAPSYEHLLAVVDEWGQLHLLDTNLPLSNSLRSRTCSSFSPLCCRLVLFVVQLCSSCVGSSCVGSSWVVVLVVFV